MGQRDQIVRMADGAVRGFGLADVTPGFLKPRAALYVDGYNLFHALLDQGRREWLWLDLKTLGKGIIRPEERLASVTWVSAHRPDRKGRMRAMFAYEQALRARDVRCLMGHFVVHGDWCQNCGHRWMSATEKQSDVNLALALASDAAADRLFAQGAEQMRDGRLRNAVDTFSRVIAMRPQFAEAWNKRATVYYLLGEDELSLKDCDEVLKRNPQHFGVLAGYGQIYLRKGDLPRALDYFEQALAINPNMAGVQASIDAVPEILNRRDRRYI